LSQTKSIRVYALARDLEVESKELLDYCKELGYDVKNQLSSLDLAQAETLTQRVKQRGKGGTAVAVAPARPADLKAPIRTTVPTLPTPQRRPAEPAHKPAAVAPPAHVEPPVTPQVTADEPAEVPPPALPTPAAPAAAALPETPLAPTAPPTLPTPAAPVAPAAQPTPPVAPAAAASSVPGTFRQPGPLSTPPVPRPPMGSQPGQMPNLSTRPQNLGSRPQNLGGAPQRPASGAPGNPPGGGGGDRRPPPRPMQNRGMVARPIAPPSLRNQGGAQPPKPAPPAPAAPKLNRVSLTPEQLQKIREKIDSNTNLDRKDVAKLMGDTARPPVAPAAPAAGAEETDTDAKGRKKPGAIDGREARRIDRHKRANDRRSGSGGVAVAAGGKLIELDERHARGRKKHRPKAPGTVPRTGKVPITTPITVRTLSEAIGMKVGQLIKKLVQEGAALTTTINSTLDTDLAEAIALDSGCELDIRRPQDAEEDLAIARKLEDAPEALQPRAPVVTIMGHVDHGKTSLLDKIRHSNVTATEAGGITQVIRAWRVEHDGKPITFLDTPGHEAFTAMRARGAQVTDIAVIVVAADDGVMPQTEEAISHAKAAGVSMIIAINKVDLPNANVERTRTRLYGLNVLPDNMGGDVPFVETSAATGKGIGDLLEAILVVAELKDLKSNPDKPAVGTCLEADLSDKEGVFATLLVEAGTLRKGDVVLCGATYGTVRAMYNDLGKPITEAGPSVPVRITGLEAVPYADDPFQVVPELTIAREIAERRQARAQEAQHFRREPMKLENLGDIKITELKVILKADFRGSIEAIRKELEKLRHEEVAVRVLHTGIGGITESDVNLALTSPEDTIILGFNVTPDDMALALAEARGVQVREYNIIYNLTNDVKSALEGKLKPREEIVHLGRAVVRETFKISKIGTVAGCHVTQGTIERSAKVRVIREGVVIYPPADRTAGLESLKHHKDDVREIKQGYDCGIKIANYDDVKVGDVIEAYRIEQVMRKL
jgi:translation initiation factor IF-2